MANIKNINVKNIAVEETSKKLAKAAKSKAPKASGKKPKQSAYRENLEKYYSATGKRRASKEVKDLLKKGYSAKKLARADKGLEGKKLERRIRDFERRYSSFTGSAATEEQKAALKYVSGMQVLKTSDRAAYEAYRASKVSPVSTTSPTVPASPAVLEKPEEFPLEMVHGDGHYNYEELPEVMKKWSHGKDRFLYTNHAWSSGFDIFNMRDGKDHTAYEAGSILVGMYSNLIYDPEKTGQVIVYEKRKWDEWVDSKAATEPGSSGK